MLSCLTAGFPALDSASIPLLESHAIPLFVLRARQVLSSNAGERLSAKVKCFHGQWSKGLRIY